MGRGAPTPRPNFNFMNRPLRVWPEKQKFLLACREAGMTYREIGELFWVQRERARQMTNIAYRIEKGRWPNHYK